MIQDSRHLLWKKIYSGARSIFKQLFLSLSPIHKFQEFFPRSMLLLCHLVLKKQTQICKSENLKG
jgi:hypothetical protein